MCQNIEFASSIIMHDLSKYDIFELNSNVFGVHRVNVVETHSSLIGSKHRQIELSPKV